LEGQVSTHDKLSTGGSVREGHTSSHVRVRPPVVSTLGAGPERLEKKV
jgi:hypothetical protein